MFQLSESEGQISGVGIMGFVFRIPKLVGIYGKVAKMVVACRSITTPLVEPPAFGYREATNVPAVYPVIAERMARHHNSLTSPSSKSVNVGRCKVEVSGKDEVSSQTGLARTIADTP
ncbi:hypothetical protein J1614_011510 [Plenodomus biglobosus]|nr:hypothetical protein J1614_011510 [Plenodomus biglobosus]